MFWWYILRDYTINVMANQDYKLYPIDKHSVNANFQISIFVDEFFWYFYHIAFGKSFFFLYSF